MQVSEWIRKFDSKRQVVQRRPPSYLTPPVNDKVLEEQAGEEVDMQEMIAYDERGLDLSDIPSRPRGRSQMQNV